MKKLFMVWNKMDINNCFVSQDNINDLKAP